MSNFISQAESFAASSEGQAALKMAENQFSGGNTGTTGNASSGGVQGLMQEAESFAGSAAGKEALSKFTGSAQSGDQATQQGASGLLSEAQNFASSTEGKAALAAAEKQFGF